MKARNFVGVTLAVAFGYIAYHGARSFLRNEITLNITELVQLPVSERMLELEEGSSLQGEIQCETYLMRSYRFYMKLSANVTGGACTPPHTARSRNRVMQVTESGSYRDWVQHASDKKEKEAPVIFVGQISSMVDHWEVVPSGKICFTPACIGDELLLSYEGTVREEYCVNATVRNCYLQADETPGLRRLSFELVVYDVVHGAKVRIALPNRYCDIVAVHTGGVGCIQQPNLQKPHHLLWDIGTVDEKTWMNVKSPTPGVLPEGRLARRGFTDDDLAAAVESNEGISSMPNTYYLSDVTESRSEQKDDDYNDAKKRMLGRRTMSGLPEGTQLLVANFILVFEEPDGLECDYVSSDSEIGKGEEDTGDSDGSKKRKSYRHPSVVSSIVGRKAAKREERARKKELQCRRVESSLLAGCGVSTRLPSVELTYSVVGLASGVTVRKLQTVSERPNWIPRSFLDRWLLWWMISSIHELRLEKFANYTTWFVQPVLVSSI